MSGREGAAGDPPLRCELALEQAAIGGPVVVRLTLENEADQDAWILPWNTPFEGEWLGTPFTVSRDGVELLYQGPMVKRMAPEADDYQRVTAGRGAAAVADLAQVYAFDAPGDYEVRVTGRLHDVVLGGPPVLPREPREGRDLACPPLRLTLPAR